MMRVRTTIWFLAAALLFTVFAPAAVAATEEHGDRFEDNQLTFLTRDLTEQSLGVVRGVYAEFRFVDFTAEQIDPAAGTVAVQLHDSRDRVVATVRSRAGVFSGQDFDRLSVPIDSVWGTLDYDEDGFWTQRRNERINGGNCQDIAYALVFVDFADEEGATERLSTRIDGPPKGSCSDIRP